MHLSEITQLVIALVLFFLFDQFLSRICFASGEGAAGDGGCGRLRSHRLAQRCPALVGGGL